MLFRSRRSERFLATDFKSQSGSAYFVGLNTKEIGCSFNLESFICVNTLSSLIDSSLFQLSFLPENRASTKRAKVSSVRTMNTGDRELVGV